MMKPDPLAATQTSTLDPSEALYAAQVALFALASLAELRESATGKHLLRVQRYVRVLCTALQQHPVHAPVLTPAYVELLLGSVPIYDMGTLGVPERILLTPGPLSEGEQAVMQTHPNVGFEALLRAEQALGKTSRLLFIAKEITHCHQEHWNGGGYPQGLRGSAIPLSARIMAVADAYDALISDKVYKIGISHEQALETIAQGRGKQFDPSVIDAFLQVHENFKTIARQLADGPEEMQQKIDFMANAVAEVAQFV
jgi:putative two-component system response regulator